MAVVLHQQGRGKEVRDMESTLRLAAGGTMGHWAHLSCPSRPIRREISPALRVHEIHSRHRDLRGKPENIGPQRLTKGEDFSAPL